MTDFFNLAATLLSGLTFFLYGMGLISKSLKVFAGGNLEGNISRACSDDFKGFIWGAFITACMQSSSALTVMTVGLVNTGILNFDNTFGLIMGSNVGTTITAWILSLIDVKQTNALLMMLNPMFLAPLLGIIGFIIGSAAKSKAKQNIGFIFVGFSILMGGMELMGRSADLVENKAWFLNFLVGIENPILAVLASTLFTGVIQSSAAAIGITESLSLHGQISLKLAVSLVLGANIGTCVTALLASAGADKNAKRVTVLHFVINILGAVICLLLMLLINPAALEAKANPSQIALIHTLFNLLSAVIFVPIKKPIMKFCRLAIK